MKIIEKLANMIDDELEGARDYAMTALEYKDSMPELARVMNAHSLAEMQHVNDLHALVVIQIEEYRRQNGEPPEGMKVLYDYLHKQHIEDAAEIKQLQSMYTVR